ncbi:MAG: T9SS type A sorting domain-containing protein [Bacteroidales bacterium]|nr:T9SS type A sorting domain-containing protein [Bacteroidales bacterium]
MKTKLSIIVLLSLLFGKAELYSQCANPSNIYSFIYNEKNYEVIKEMKTWNDASACAVERNGYLVEINDMNEQTAINDALVRAGVNTTYTSIENGGDIAYVWIGATDQTTEGTWLWNGNNDANGTHFWTGQGAGGTGNGVSVNELFNNWGGKSNGAAMEPDNYGSGQHYAAIGLAGWPSGTTSLGIAGEWNDIIGSSLLYFIIEKNTGVGIDEGNSQNEFKIFPNPSFDKLFIEAQNISIGSSYEILDLTGKLMVKDAFKVVNEIDIAELTKGVYLLKIEAKNATSIKFTKE